MLPSKLIDYSDLIGRPFRHGGRGPDHFDCYGLVMHIHRRFFGIDLPDYNVVNEHDKMQTMIWQKLHLWKQIESRPNATVLLRVEGYGAHLGFQVDNYRFLHTWERSGGVLREPLDSSDWALKRIGFYEYVG